MRSILESQPELIEALGMITARWTVMEYQLAELLGCFTKSRDVGPTMMYGVTNFSQRLMLVDKAVRTGITHDTHRTIALKGLEKIRKLWNKRNKLSHSLYVYRIETEYGYTEHRLHPGEIESIDQLGRITFDKLSISATSDNGAALEGMVDGKQDRELRRTIGYHHHTTTTTEPEFKPVNRAALINHADRVIKRAQQVATFRRAIDRGRVPIRAGTPSSSP